MDFSTKQEASSPGQDCAIGMMGNQETPKMDGADQDVGVNRDLPPSQTPPLQPYPEDEDKYYYLFCMSHVSTKVTDTLL